MQILIHVDLPTETERNNNNSSDNPVKSKHKPTDAVSATSQFEFDGENKHFEWKSEGKSRSKSKSSESFSFLASDADPYQRQESWGLIGRYRAGIIFSFDESKEHAKHNRLLRQDELNSWIVQFHRQCTGSGPALSDRITANYVLSNQHSGWLSVSQFALISRFR